MTKCRQITRLEQVATRYNAILCDIWGVLHNGKEVYTDAVRALCHFKETSNGVQRRVLLLSNAPRLNKDVAGFLSTIGITPTAYDAILTSGDLTREILLKQQKKFVYHLGPARDLSIYEGTDIELATLENAETVVCTGVLNDEFETVQDYESTLLVCCQRGLKMICANPDLVVERDGRTILCAGSLAAAYSSLGGEVLYIGKPDIAIYEAARSALETYDHLKQIRRSQILAIGDSLLTDVAGAEAAGIDSVLIARGIHARQFRIEATRDDNVLDMDWLGRQNIKPNAIMRSLVW